MGIEFLGLARITPLVLLPSDRLPGLRPPPIIVLLWFRILRQVPGRAREGLVCLKPFRRWFGEWENARICESACTSQYYRPLRQSRPPLFWLRLWLRRKLGRRKGTSRPAAS